MTDQIKRGSEATRLLHDTLWRQYQDAAITDLTKQLVEADIDDIDGITRIKTILRHVQGFEAWMVGETRNAKWAERKKAG